VKGLCRLLVRDFDKTAATVHIELSKSRKPRNVALTEEGVAHLQRLARGKTGNDLLLTRSDGSPWDASHQIRRMMEACKKAKISPAVSFHILRHTYGSRLAMKGAPMAVIAAQLGHADTRMTERHYAHLGPSYVSDVVRGLLGSIGVPIPDDNAVAIERAKSA
jgi:integrase